MKRGVIENCDGFKNWLSALNRHEIIKRETVTIQIKDENKNPLKTWTLNNAWPCNISTSALNADGNEVAIESLELVHEGITLS